MTLPTLPVALVADTTSEAGALKLPSWRAGSTQCPVLEDTACANRTCLSRTQICDEAGGEEGGCVPFLVEGLSDETHGSRGHLRPGLQGSPFVCCPIPSPTPRGQRRGS